MKDANPMSHILVTERSLSNPPQPRQLQESEDRPQSLQSLFGHSRAAHQATKGSPVNGPLQDYSGLARQVATLMILSGAEDLAVASFACDLRAPALAWGRGGRDGILVGQSQADA